MFVIELSSSFRDILSEHTMTMLEEEMYLDLLVFKGVAARTRHCKMKTLDLRGLEISMGTSVAVPNKKKSSFNQCVTFLTVLL